MLTGACISRAGFNRTTAYSTAVWVLASEWPDVDVLYYVRGSVEAFAHHRGWTHTFIAAPLNAALVVGGLYLFWKWRERRQSREPETRHAASLREESARLFSPSLDSASASPRNQAPRWGLLFFYGILASF